ncbi:hypothetical protein HYS03_02275 [Candidatus Woesebacteria bacterium]|nr:hypothetical protein [Candidatus Woesebacteria bacterium]QQG47705.1 MAG: hypothetical protein HY044_01285 [Candidatus Woesebacteria bacterium]
MRKFLVYSSFLISSLVVIAMFVTATTYVQLAVAIVLYPGLVYFALKAFLDKDHKMSKLSIVKVKPSVSIQKEEEVSDIDKRGFLKVIGAAGLSFFLFSILGKRTQVPFFGKVTGPATTALEDINGNKIDPAQLQPTDGYRISEIDDNVITYYGFTNKDGKWFIMREDTDTSSFRYTKGDSGFPGNWDKRVQLRYDYFHNVF